MKLKDLSVIVKGKTPPYYGDLAAAEGGRLDINKMMEEKTDKENVREIQKRMDDILIVHNIMKHGTAMPLDIRDLKIYKSYHSWLDKSENSELAKAMQTGTAGSGAEWVPTGFSSQLIEMVQLEHKVMNFFDEFDMPQNPYTWPIQDARPTFYKVTEGANATESNPGTDNITFTALKAMGYSNVSYELTEDAIISMLPFIKKTLTNGIVRTKEDAMINGCADNSIDSDNSTAADVRRIIINGGLRKLAIANAYTTSLATFNSDTIAGLRKAMLIYGANPNDLVWIMGTKVSINMLGLKDNQNNRVVVGDDVSGSVNTWKTGKQAQMLGSPLVASEHMRETLTALGTYDASGITTQAAMLCVYRPGYKVGYARKIMLETDKNIINQTVQLVASLRMDMRAVQPIATNHTVDYGVNITP